MAGPVIKIPIDDRPFDDLNGQIKERKKDLRDLQKEVKKTEDAGQRATKETLDKIKKTEAELSRLNRTKAQQGGALREQQQYNQQHAQLSANNDHIGMLRLQAERRIGQYMKSGTMGGNALKGANSLLGGGGGIGAMVGKAGIVAAVLAEGPAFVKNLSRVVDNASEAARERERDYSVYMASNASVINPVETALATARKKQADYDEKIKNFNELTGIAGRIVSNVPLIGDLLEKAVNAPRDAIEYGYARYNGLDYTARANLERHNMLQKSNVLGIQSEGLRITGHQQVALAEKRYFADKYGSGLGAAIGLGYDFARGMSKGAFTLDSTEKGITEQLEKNQAAFNKLRDEGFALVEQNDFIGAEEALKKATKEIAPAADKAYRTPESAWYQLDAGKNADVNYFWSQVATPQLRIGQ